MATKTSSVTMRNRLIARLLPEGMTLRDNVAGWLFVSPSVFLILIFGIFPIFYAVYMSMHRWRIQKGRFLGLDNFTDVIGDWGGAFLFIIGFILLYCAYVMWTVAFSDGRKEERFLRTISAIPGRLLGIASGAMGAVILVFSLLFSLLSHTDETGIQQSEAMLLAAGMVIGGIALYYGAGALWKHILEAREDPPVLLRVMVAFVVMGIAMYMIVVGYTRMIDLGHEDFLHGLTITFWFAFSSVPVQLALGLVLAYVLFQSIKGKQWYRMIFFLPYVAPDVAMAVVFRVVFSPRDNSLANQVIGIFGIEPQRWVQEDEFFVNAIFGLNLDGFIAGPSMALISIVLLGIWKYVGYNAVIFLAGLGSIPKDLYEAAKVDGGTEWHLFRHITLPLLSPVTFYLAILAFIGTFKAFNSIYVMRDPFAGGTVDVASIVVFDTFYKASRFGLAAAQAIVLFFVILSLTQVLRNVFEKRVFYG